MFERLMSHTYMAILKTFSDFQLLPIPIVVANQSIE